MKPEKKAFDENNIIVDKVQVIKSLLSLSTSPFCLFSDRYIGKSTIDILAKYTVDRVVCIDKKDKGIFEIEIRTNSARTTCYMVNNICKEEYVFYDREPIYIIPKSVSNYLQTKH